MQLWTNFSFQKMDIKSFNTVFINHEYSKISKIIHLMSFYTLHANTTLLCCHNEENWSCKSIKPDNRDTPGLCSSPWRSGVTLVTRLWTFTVCQKNDKLLHSVECQLSWVFSTYRFCTVWCVWLFYIPRCPFESTYDICLFKLS